MYNTVKEYVEAKRQQWKEEGWEPIDWRFKSSGKCIEHGDDVDIYIVTEHSKKLGKSRQYSKRVGCCG